METEFRRVDFGKVAGAAAAQAEAVCRQWLPDGRREAGEWVARNPRRQDHRPGSFKVNLRTGRWGDFASDDRGGDLVSLAAYLFGMSQRDAALQVAKMVGLDPFV